MEKKTKYYKILGVGGVPCNGGSGQWHLPKGNRPGKWMPKIKGELEPCRNGYHVCRRNDLVAWLNQEIYEAEIRGEQINHTDKVVAREARLIRKMARWDECTARLFACDCAEHVLHIFEKHNKTDSRPRNAIEVARRFADGEATKGELAAARDAAGVAAGVAARAAARAAAGDAARAAERQWQTKRLFQYLNGKVK